MPNFDKKNYRGLTGREVLALLMMVGSQLIVTVVMLQMMLNGGVEGAGDGNGMAVPNVLNVVQAQVPFVAAAPHAVKMNGNGGGDQHVILMDSSEEEKKEGGKMEMGKDSEGTFMMNGNGNCQVGAVSEYLLTTKQTIANRITCHRTFVTEKKNALVMALWELIEGVYEMEELIEDSTSSGDGDDDSTGTSTSTGAASVAADAGSQTHVHGFRKEVEEKMMQNDFAGVLTMVQRSIRGFPEGREEKFNLREGSSSMDHHVEESKHKIYRGFTVSREILQEMEEEMRDMEVWMKGMEGVLREVVAEFLSRL
ncbi:hypothetical protein NHQ30_007095 [Ciborinia camelliae]|nr:hypothetical protein NHQ30_007095 [Ciborinia camelliae]